MGGERSEKLAQTHSHVFTVWVGPAPVVVLSGFQVVKKALVSHSEKLSGRPLTPLFRDLVGERGKAALPAGDGVAGSTAKAVGALVFSRHFLSEDPFFQELIQTINFGLAFVSTIWCRLRWCSRRQVCGSLDPWGSDTGRGLSQGITGSADSVLAPERPLDGPLTPQLNDLFPWGFCCLPGPYQEMFRYQKAVWGYIHRELSRHKLRTSEARKDFISYYLAQVIKAGLRGLQRARCGGEGRRRGRGRDRGETELQHRPGTHAELPAERVLQELDAVLGTSRAIRCEDRGDCSTPALSSRRRSASAAS
ncbi:unnamed protein product [Rangifer tarandus platyrhynchus]|uniref:Uncharacterized protein n=1 Tax=Rangifer tarandus platyrhynchus TaxID=3082113 RepID=A0ABN8ZNG7_RANTA|nr:unnamed protein product [Rangifer tarandus platyrhynchus]